MLGPIFAAETHGYDTIDHFTVDPRLGDQADFDHLVAEAGRRGLRIVLDGVFNHVGRSFPAFQAALAGGPDSPAARWFRRHNGVTPQTFVGNHDVTRLASQLTDDRHIGHALAVLFTVAGIPSVYYGDEQAFGGVKETRAGGDDEIRPSVPASPAELPPDGWPTYRLHQRLIGFRRRHPWLVRARTSALHLTNGAIAYRAAADGAEIVVLLNIGDNDVRFGVDVGDLAVSLAADPGTRPGDPLLVPGHSWVIFG